MTEHLHFQGWCVVTTVVMEQRLPLGTSSLNYGPFRTQKTHPFRWDASVTVAQRWLFWILERSLLNSPTSPASHVQVITDGISDLRDGWVMWVMPWGISGGAVQAPYWLAWEYQGVLIKPAFEVKWEWIVSTLEQRADSNGMKFHREQILCLILIFEKSAVFTWWIKRLALYSITSGSALNIPVEVNSLTSFKKKKKTDKTPKVIL